MNIYCFSTLSFAKLQFKSVINKAFHKHGVASFTYAWIETACRCCWPYYGQSHLLQMRGLKRSREQYLKNRVESHLLQMRGLKHRDAAVFKLQQESHLLQMRGLKLAWKFLLNCVLMSHLLQMRGLKLI